MKTTNTRSFLKLAGAYTLLIVGTFLIVFYDYLGGRLLELHYKTDTPINWDDAVVAWGVSVKYLGCACFVMGAVERICSGA